VQLGIEGHTNLTIISADGYYTKPAQTDHVQLAGGQRFDVLLTAKLEAELYAEGRDQYWIRYETRGRSTDLSGYALLQYSFDSSITKHRRDTEESRHQRRGDRSGSHQDENHRWQPKPLGKNPRKSPVSLPPDGTLTGWLEYTLEALSPVATFPSLEDVTRTIYITLEEKIINGTYAGGTVTGSLIWV
jgi:hypothetical protein